MTRTARRRGKKDHGHDASTWSELSAMSATQKNNSSHAKRKKFRKQSIGLSLVEDVDERREKMRQKRRLRRAYSKVCFKCRQPGHRLESCQNGKSDEVLSVNICFKCGSAEHNVKSCKADVPFGTYPFAHCFICGESGHLSRSCPDNPRGLYPNGGGCKLCGSVEHFKANCPTKHMTLTEDYLEQSNDDCSNQALSHRSKSKKKVVKF